MSDTSAVPKASLPARAPQVRRFQMPRTVGALMLREMSTTYGKSSLGYLWTVAEPIGSILLLSLVFGVVLRAPALGDNFPLFYATGVMVYGMWATTAGKVGTALLFSRQLISYPGVTFLDAIVARFLLTALTQTLTAYIVFTAIIVGMDVDVTLRIEWVALAVLLTFVSAAGLGVFNAYMLPAFAWYRPVYSIVMRPMFLISTTIYVFESIPPPYDAWLLLNPLVHVIGFMRRGIYLTYDAPWASALYVVGLAMVGVVAGLALLRREARVVLDR